MSKHFVDRSLRLSYSLLQNRGFIIRTYVQNYEFVSFKMLSFVYAILQLLCVVLRYAAGIFNNMNNFLTANLVLLRFLKKYFKISTLFFDVFSYYESFSVIINSEPKILQ